MKKRPQSVRSLISCPDWAKPIILLLRDIYSTACLGALSEAGRFQFRSSVPLVFQRKRAVK